MKPSISPGATMKWLIRSASRRRPRKTERPSEPQLAFAAGLNVLAGLEVYDAHLDAFRSPDAGLRPLGGGLVEAVEHAERVQLRHAVGLIGLRHSERVDDVVEEAIAPAARHAEAA